MRRAAIVLSAAVLMVGLTTVGFTQECKIPIFAGDLDAVELGSWGSGNVEVDEEETYLEANALRVETKGFFEGGRLDLQQPLAADQFLADPSGGYIRLVVKVHEPEAQMQGPGMGPGMEPGMMPPGMEPGMMPPGMEPGMMPPGMEPGMMPPGMEPGMMPPGMEPGMMPPGMEPGMMPPGMEPGMMEPGMMPPGMEPGMMEPGMGPGMRGAQVGPPPKIERLRVLIVTDKGAIDSGAIELADYAELVEDWKQIVVPLDRFAGQADLEGAEIQHIALFGDVEETFWVGEIGMGYETQPLVADAGENIVTKVETITQFEAAPQPEGVTANYVWDFDALDGIQEDGFGRETSWTFLTPGYYTVTLTVRDPNGRRVERTDQVQVKVEE